MVKKTKKVEVKVDSDEVEFEVEPAELKPADLKEPEKPKKTKKTKKPKDPSKPKRAPSVYSTFVKNNYDSVRSFPVKLRFVELGKIWRKQKADKAETK
jgi:hypothetical protein